MSRGRSCQTGSTCPHADVQFCPLYIASHGIDGHFGMGCDDGRLDEGGCAVERGQDYAASVAELRAKAPRAVALIEFAEWAATARDQQRRNLTLNGIH